MFGLLAGMMIFSVATTQWARQELVRIQQQKAARQKAQAEDVAKAIEFTLLTETPGSYSDTPDRQRIMANTSMATAKTAGDEDVLIVDRQTEKDVFDKRTTRMAVTASDDTLLRSKVYRSATADDLSAIPNGQNGVVTVDTAAIRQRQVVQSAENMSAVGEYVYGFYAGHLRWPNQNEFEDLEAESNLHDVWGQNFTYTPIDDQSVRLELTTPWNYTHAIVLSLKDDASSAKLDPNNEDVTKPSSPSILP